MADDDIPPEHRRRVLALVTEICRLFQEEGRMDGDAGPIVSTALTEIVARWLCAFPPEHHEEQAARLIKWSLEMAPLMGKKLPPKSMQ